MARYRRFASVSLLAWAPALVLTAHAAAPAIVAAAQEDAPAAATPEAVWTACRAEPRDIDAMVALWFDDAGMPAATPVIAAPVPEDAALPEGERAADAIVAAITETTLDWLYCVEAAGQYARGFSHLTDTLAAQFGPNPADPSQDTPEEVRALLEGQLQGTPTAADQGVPMPPVAGPRKAQVLDDGRVVATWVFRGDKIILLYVQEGDRWLIDEAIDLIEIEGTPAATPTS